MCILALAACKTEPGDEGTGTDSGTSVGTTAGTTSLTTTSTGVITTTTDGTTSTTTSTTAPTTTDAGTTGATDPGTTTSDATGDTTTGGSGRCMMYCQDIMAACTGPEAQYASLASCVNVCDTFRAGMPNDMSGNSFSCRRYHTNAAVDDPTTHCVHAGPGGGGGCGDNCDGFCSIARAICPDEYPDDACQAYCSGLDDSEKYDISDAAGDTLACRLYHLTVAATSETDAATHCPHTESPSATCL